MKLRPLSTLVLLATALTPRAIPAQTLRSDDWLANGPVKTLTTLGGTIYLGGNFSRVGPATGGLGVFDASTGTMRQPFPRVAGLVLSVAPDGSGGCYLGGFFTAVSGQARNNLAQIDASGNPTSW